MEAFLPGLQHNDPTMRSYYAHGLHENAGKIEDRRVLRRMLRPLATAMTTLKVTAPDTGGAEAGELSYFALRQALEKVDDQGTLRAIIPSLTRALNAEEVKRRRYAAHTIMLLGPKLKDPAALTPLLQPLIAAHFHDPDQKVREAAGMALKRCVDQDGSSER